MNYVADANTLVKDHVLVSNRDLQVENETDSDRLRNW
jgi:hypothetical protein